MRSKILLITASVVLCIIILLFVVHWLWSEVNNVTDNVLQFIRSWNQIVHEIYTWNRSTHNWLYGWNDSHTTTRIDDDDRESTNRDTQIYPRARDTDTHTHSHDYMVWWAWTPISPIKLLPPLCYDRIVIIRYKTSDPIKSRLGEDCVFQFVASMIGKYFDNAYTLPLHLTNQFAIFSRKE